MSTRSRVITWCFAAAISIGACAEEREPESSVASRQAFRFGCPATDLGLACDPDGAGELLGQCQGLCTLDPASATPNRVCVPISELGLPNLSRYPCGSPACSHTCDPAGQCVPVPAADGTACFFAFAVDKCTGQCEDGACTLIPQGQRCTVGEDESGCAYSTCEALEATTCKTLEYAPGATCAGGTCNGCGVCGAAPANCLCGNGRLDATELCDGTALDGATCATVTMGALPAGTLSCSSTCRFVTTGCTPADSGGSAGAGGNADASADGRAGSANAGNGGSAGLAEGGAAGAGNTGGAAAGSGGISSEAGVAGSGAAFKLGRVAEGGGCDCRAGRSASGREQVALGTLLALFVAFASYRRRRGPRT
ncbi:MAG TPA: hypothetical protein VI072_29120 [Polyangiaceae bacterium]